MNYQNYFPNYMQSFQAPQASTQPQPQASPQAQAQSAFISVKNIDEAMNWPIAPGCSLTFKDESAPYIYVKTSGLSQFEPPAFEKYRITKEEDPKPDDLRAEFSGLEAQIEEVKDAYRLLKSELDEMKNWMRQPFLSSEQKERATYGQ